MFWKIIRYFFFWFDAERAHYLAMDLLSLAIKIPILNKLLIHSFSFDHPDLHGEFIGMACKNPIGLAAGFDKDGRWLKLLPLLGFGHIELGTVTPFAQEGNAKPRLFRLKKDESIINRMGFNNLGVEQLALRLQEFQKPEGFILGGNIGKNKNTSPEKTVDDYLYCFKILFPYVDYFTINVSSPNTPGLRQLQEKEPLDQLLSSIQQENENQPQPKPLFLKIAPDLENAALDDILEVALKNKLSGIIVSNTSITRPESLKEKQLIHEAGGLSGAAIRELAQSKLEYLVQKSNGSMNFIGVGGIFTASDAIQRMQAGAGWIQIYSGLIYEGPWMVKKIKRGLAEGEWKKRRYQGSRPKAEGRS
ncbi:MAG: quinone-dependent dihydroorotate dehydrogenase [Saprospiraceae bacterium]|nr:quinone-dependent dihydroorotate dehydrogenase [Saprospiraceae bacterium]